MSWWCASGVIYAPVFDRRLEESTGSAVAVPAAVPLVITEGNYLLLDQPGWAGVRDHLDEAWFLDVAADERVNRLVARRQSFGETAHRAQAWVQGVDESNALVVQPSRARADLLVQLTTQLGPPAPDNAPAGATTTSPNPKEL